MVKRILALSLLMVGLAGCGSGDGGGAETLLGRPRVTTRPVSDPELIKDAGTNPLCVHIDDLGRMSELEYVATDMEMPIDAAAWATVEYAGPNTAIGPTTYIATDKRCDEYRRILYYGYTLNIAKIGLDVPYVESDKATTLTQICQDDAYSACGNATDGTWGIIN